MRHALSSPAFTLSMRSTSGVTVIGRKNAGSAEPVRDRPGICDTWRLNCLEVGLAGVGLGR